MSEEKRFITGATRHVFDQCSVELLRMVLDGTLKHAEHQLLIRLALRRFRTDNIVRYTFRRFCNEIEMVDHDNAQKRLRRLIELNLVKWGTNKHGEQRLMINPDHIWGSTSGKRTIACWIYNIGNYDEGHAAGLRMLKLQKEIRFTHGLEAANDARRNDIAV